MNILLYYQIHSLLHFYYLFWFLIQSFYYLIYFVLQSTLLALDPDDLYPTQTAKAGRNVVFWAILGFGATLLPCISLKWSGPLVLWPGENSKLTRHPRRRSSWMRVAFFKTALTCCWVFAWVNSQQHYGWVSVSDKDGTCDVWLTFAKMGNEPEMGRKFSGNGQMKGEMHRFMAEMDRK